MKSIFEVQDYLAEDRERRGYGRVDWVEEFRLHTPGYINAFIDTFCDRGRLLRFLDWMERDRERIVKPDDEV